MGTEVTANATVVGLAFTMFMGLLLVVLPRRYAFVPIVVLVCYMTMGEAVVIAGGHFTMIRMLMLFGWARLVLRGELRKIKLNQLDKIILWFVLVSFLSYIALWQTFDAVIYKLGAAYNALGFYFLFRMLLREFRDVQRMFKIMAAVVVPLAGLMLLEKATGRNLFAIFGGVAEETTVRDGVLRCMGPFAHPILAGTFGATLVAFFCVLWHRGASNKLLATIGVGSALAITYASGSSGPVLTVAAGVGALCLWGIRKKMRLVRWGIVAMLAALQIVMKPPVWFILAKLDVFSGSTGFHRALLIDRAVANLGDWWLFGTKSTAAWADADQHLFDVTSQYILVGAESGLLSMILFIWIIVRAFRLVGLSVRGSEKWGEPKFVQFAVWGLGAALFAHTMTYLSVAYFDQNFVNWYLLLAMIATAADQFVYRPQVEAAVAPAEVIEALAAEDPVTADADAEVAPNAYSDPREPRRTVWQS